MREGQGRTGLIGLANELIDVVGGAKGGGRGNRLGFRGYGWSGGKGRVGEREVFVLITLRFGVLLVAC